MICECCGEKLRDSDLMCACAAVTWMADMFDPSWIELCRLYHPEDKTLELLEEQAA